jgi:hypothetical protein
MLELRQRNGRLATFDISAAAPLADEEVALDDARRLKFAIFSHNGVVLSVFVVEGVLGTALGSLSPL